MEDEKISLTKEELQKMIQEAIEAAKAEERKKQELEAKRKEYIEKIKQYFPGAKDDVLNTKSTEELENIAKNIESMAQIIGHTPVSRKETLPLSFAMAIKTNLTTVLLMFAVLGLVVVAFLLR